MRKMVMEQRWIAAYYDRQWTKSLANCLAKKSRLTLS
jgi:hypothetical protein